MRKTFQTLFPDTDESIIRHAYSPYRICPVGAHVDHQHGHVTGFALDHGVDLYYIPTKNGIINLFSRDFEGQVLFTMDDLGEKPTTWGRYVKAAIYSLSKNYELENGIQGLISGSLPVGGLSSSAAVLLCYIMALADVNHISLSEKELIQAAFEAEKEYIGLNLGTLDHSCEVLCRKDNLLYLDTRDNSYKLIPSPENMPEFDLFIFFSGLTRTLINTGYNTRTDECKVAAFSLYAYEGLPYTVVKDMRLRMVHKTVFEKWKDKLPEPLSKRAAHFMSEHDRVDDAVRAYAEGDIAKLGKIMFESGWSSITQWESGCEETIELYNIMKTTPGIYGGRFSGAGFKGCCIAIGDPAKRDEITESVSRRYLEKFPELTGKYSVHVCKTADGARRIK
ncbi:galactokinase family protein [Saccharicrinis sp. FJH62]|uniref:GHMP family kinase ATP-binding protein n=1 Tax=Saccharicrinis sp. FJH62 TaxID=3344657 RepID=UPI0035D5124A